MSVATQKIWQFVNKTNVIKLKDRVRPVFFIFVPQLSIFRKQIRFAHLRQNGPRQIGTSHEHRCIQSYLMFLVTLCMVPPVRLERTRPCGHQILSLACLPIPPQGLWAGTAKKQCSAYYPYRYTGQ